VGEGLEAIEKVWRDEAPGLLAVACFEGVHLGIVGTGKNDPVPDGRGPGMTRSERGKRVVGVAGVVKKG
jgi:hypothetical protein